MTSSTRVAAVTATLIAAVTLILLAINFGMYGWKRAGSPAEDYFHVSTPDMLARIQQYNTAAAKPWEREAYSMAIDHQTLPANLVKKLEDQFGKLSEEERALLQVKVQGFKDLYLSAMKRYSAEMARQAADRAAKGKLASVDPADRDIFAASSVGGTSVRWSKVVHAELYQSSLVGRYICTRMLDDLKAFFESRSKQ